MNQKTMLYGALGLAGIAGVIYLGNQTLEDVPSWELVAMVAVLGISAIGFLTLKETL